VQGDNAAPTTSASKKSATASPSWFRVAGTHLNVRDIQDAVIAHFRMPRVELFAKRRNKATVRRRHIAIYLSKILTIQSLPEIGRRFGGLDHTTILYASRKIERALHKDAELAQDVAELERVLTALEETRA
jgi:chromosomal replication initiator protein